MILELIFGFGLQAIEDNSNKNYDLVSNKVDVVTIAKRGKNTRIAYPLEAASKRGKNTRIAYPLETASKRGKNTRI